MWTLYQRTQIISRKNRFMPLWLICLQTQLLNLNKQSLTCVQSSTMFLFSLPASLFVLSPPCECSCPPPSLCTRTTFSWWAWSCPWSWVCPCPWSWPWSWEWPWPFPWSWPWSCSSSCRLASALHLLAPWNIFTWEPWECPWWSSSPCEWPWWWWWWPWVCPWSPWEWLWAVAKWDANNSTADVANVNASRRTQPILKPWDVEKGEEDI